MRFPGGPAPNKTVIMLKEQGAESVMNIPTKELEVQIPLLGRRKTRFFVEISKADQIE